jgi:hypothetical protein
MSPTHNPRRRRLAQAVSTISQTQANARRQQKGRASADPADRLAAYKQAMAALEAFFTAVPQPPGVQPTSAPRR